VGRLFIVFAAYRSTGLPQVQRYVRLLQQRYQPQAMVVVDNGDKAPVGWVGSVPVIASNNRLREFSAWDDGVAWLQHTAGLHEDDWILFANDTVCRQAHLRWLTLGRARRVIRRLVDSAAGTGPLAAGPVVRCPMGEVRGFDTPFTEFVATFFFAMPYRAYVRIGGLGAALPWNQWLGTAWPEPLFRMPDEAAYNRFCNQWLGCDQPGGVGGWPGSAARPFTADNYAFLRGKAQCILLEGRLAAELSALHLRVAVNLYHRAPWNELLRRLFRLVDGNHT
jgi:hypothetical protein